jgi:predicted SAM-dependent methyltransferase
METPKTRARKFLSAIRSLERALTQPLRIAWYHMGRGRRIADYLAGTDTPSLILGSGVHRHPGWLASDIAPGHGDAIFLDGRRRLPFADNTLAYVFAEHMIEHIAYRDGVFLAAEIFRVLRPGGVFRVATPDLEAIARLVGQPDAPDVQAFLDASSGLWQVSGAKRASFAVNRFFYWWGHRFIYDRRTLEETLRGAGFVAIERCAPRQSTHAALRELEIHADAVGKVINDYETLVLEASKPLNAGGAGPNA